MQGRPERISSRKVIEIFGITTRPSAFGVVNAKLRNVPEAIPGSWMYPDPGPTLPQTYYYAE